MDQSKAISDLAASNVAQRVAAAEWLSQQTDLSRDAIVALLETIAEADEQVREWAVAALESLESPDPTSVDHLAARVGHASDDVAYWAATLLGRLGDAADTACQNLIAVLDSEQASLVVRERAAWALGKIGVSPQSEEALQRAAQSKHSRLAAMAKRIVAAT